MHRGGNNVWREHVPGDKADDDDDDVTEDGDGENVPIEEYVEDDLIPGEHDDDDEHADGNYDEHIPREHDNNAHWNVTEDDDYEVEGDHNVYWVREDINRK